MPTLSERAADFTARRADEFCLHGLTGRNACASLPYTLVDSINSSPLGSPSGVIHSEATIRQHLIRLRFPNVILFEATRSCSEVQMMVSMARV
jgi:hypothetical protein